MIERTGFRRRGKTLRSVSLAVGGLLLATGGWAVDGEKTRVARARPSAEASGAGRQASVSRPSSRPSVSSQQSTGSTSSPRAVPRQPTARDTREHPPGQWKPPGGSGGGGGGGGGYHPGWGGYWGTRYPWYWNRWCWGWPSCWGWSWGWGYWGPYWYSPPPPAYRVYSTPHVPSAAATQIGAVNLMVKPKKAEVYVDGRFAGRAKDFDGYPGYLWLEEGTHEISLVQDGYATFSDRVTVRSGYVTDVRLRLERGLSTPAPVPTPEVAESAPEAEEREGSARQATAEPNVEQDARAEPGHLELVVQPPDASVYLDGRLLGSGQELASLHAALLVDPGAHSLEMVRPGYAPQQLDFEVEPGQTVSLQVTLEFDGQ